MKQHSIRRHVAWLTLTPLLIMAVSLESFFLHNHYSDLDRNLMERGQLIASQLASSSEYGVFANNQPFLRNIAQGVLQQPDVQGVIILDATSGVLIEVGKFSGAPENAASDDNTASSRVGKIKDVVNLHMPVYRSSEGLWIYQPIVPAQVVVDELDAKPEVKQAGAVIVAMSSVRTEQLKSQVLWLTVGSTALFLIFPFYLIYLGSRSITSPIRKLSDAIRAIGDGRLETRVSVSPQVTELETLSHGMNDMAAKLQQEQVMLQQRTAKLIEAQRIAHLGNWEWDVVNNTLIWSDEIYRILGLTPQQFGATYEAFLQAVHPDDRQSVEDRFREALKAGRPQSMDHRILLPDGSVRYVHEQVEVLRNDDGLSVKMLGTTQDITELKLAAEALRKANVELSLYRKLLDHSSDAIEVFDPVTMRFLDVNERACRDLGYSREELLSMSIFDIDPSFTPDAKKMIDEQMQKSGTARFEGIHRRKDGSTFAVEVSIGSANLDKPYGLGIVRDITERKRTEIDRREYQRLLRELAAQDVTLQEAKYKHIAREVHDELGQILTALRMDVSLLRIQFGGRDPVLMKKIQDMLVLIDKAIQGVRNVAVNLHPPALDMGIIPAIAWLCDEFQKRTATASTLRVVDDPVGLDDAHTVAIFRIVQESLTNVWRHAAANSVEITIWQRGDDIVVEVRDDGKGFDLAAMPTKGSFGLLGMRERAIAVGGKVEIASAPSKGTVVSVRIPARRGENNL